MKNLMTKMVVNITNYVLLFLLLYAVLTQTQSLVGLTVAVYWVIMSLGLFIGPLIYILSHAAKSAKDEESRRKALEIIGDSAKKRNVLLRSLGWAELIIISCLLAYSGWIFTAVCYVLTSLYMRLFISMARDNVATLNDKEVGRDGTIKC